jgi:hypothetical protein
MCKSFPPRSNVTTPIQEQLQTPSVVIYNSVIGFSIFISCQSTHVFQRMKLLSLAIVNTVWQFFHTFPLLKVDLV